MEELYLKLRDRLDEMATGHPSTESGVEVRILQKLFNPEEASLFLTMTTTPETPREIAHRAGIGEQNAAMILEPMARKGLVFRLREESMVRYFAIPFIVGIYEFQINNLDDPLVKDISEYYLSGLAQSFHSLKTPHLRTLPVNKDLVSKKPILPYDDAASIIRGKDRIAVAPCLCRLAVRRMAKGCDSPLETCIQFDSFADYYVDNDMARYISTDEALSILQNNEKAGLVIQTLNSQNVEAMCACCSCCCGMLISLKLYPAPAREVKSNYYCSVTADSCSACGTCVSRCPVNAIRVKENIAEVSRKRCIGCGLCVSTCPDGILSLEKKPEEEMYEPPKTVFETFDIMTVEKKGGI